MSTEEQTLAAEWRSNVLDELRQLNQRASKIETDIATLKVKSSLWGAAGAGFVILLKLLIDIKN